MQSWQILLAGFGGSAVLITALGFFSKALVKQLLEKDIEEFKNSLKIATVEHEIIFSRLHDKKIEIISDLYASLKEVLLKARDYVEVLGYQGQPTRKEKRTALYEAVNAFAIKFEKNKIWLEEELSKKIESLYTELIKPARELIAEEMLSEEKLPSNKHQKWLEAFEKYQKEIPDVVSLIESEFRKELGVFKAGSKGR